MRDLKNGSRNFLSENYFYHKYLQKLTPQCINPPPHPHPTFTAVKVTPVR